MDPETEQHLKVLSVFYYVVAGIAALVSLFPIIHLTMGLFLLAGPEKYLGLTEMRNRPTEVASPEKLFEPSGGADGPTAIFFAHPFDEAEMGVTMMRLTGGVFAVVASVMILLGMSLAICMVLTGRNLARRRKHLFCVVGSGIACVFMPLGTVLGVFAVLVLLKPGVKDAFAS